MTDHQSKRCLGRELEACGNRPLGVTPHSDVNGQGTISTNRGVAAVADGGPIGARRGGRVVQTPESGSVP